ncbi:hypothetical protein B0H14DRAFT_2584861 [Mycena olivaceomarginata]|nr:hypothetical protein B0H14DRAFT_2584861 [Mycena olivaceomarginata]
MSSTYTNGDRFAFVADVGWTTGHTYIMYGPLFNGVSTLIFESTPVYPSPARYWMMTLAMLRLVYDNAEVFEVGQKMPDDVFGGPTRHPDLASITALDQLVADRTMFFPRREVVRAPLPAGESVLTDSDHQPSHTHDNYGATMDASTRPERCDAPYHSRPCSRIHCTRGGRRRRVHSKGVAHSRGLRARSSQKALSVTIKLPVHVFSAHGDGVDGATTEVLSAEGLERAWGGVGTPEFELGERALGKKRSANIWPIFDPISGQYLANTTSNGKISADYYLTLIWPILP